MHTIEQVISSHPLFEGLDSNYLNIIAGCGFNVKFAADDLLCKENENADHFYIIRHGKVSIEIPTQGPKPIKANFLFPGDIVGYTWLIPPYKYKSNNKADETTMAIVFDGKYLRTQCEINPKMGYELLKRVTHLILQSLNETRAQLLNIYNRNIF